MMTLLLSLLCRACQAATPNTKSPTPVTPGNNASLVAATSPIPNPSHAQRCQVQVTTGALANATTVINNADPITSFGCIPLCTMTMGTSRNASPATSAAP